QVFNGEFAAVVQNDEAGKAAEDLMLDGAQDLEVRCGGAINDRLEIHFKASVAGGEGPRCAVEGALRYVERHLAQLMRLAVEEDHILGGGGCVAEAIADVETEAAA